MSIADKMRLQGYVSASEAAQKVGRSVHTIYRWQEDGIIESVNIGGHHFVKIKSLIDYLGVDAAELLGVH